MRCPKCDHALSRSEIASAFGSLTSKKKSEASRNNGKKGGAPKKKEKLKEILKEVRKASRFSSVKDLEQAKKVLKRSKKNG